MEVLLDIALTILGTLGQGHQPGKALGRLHTTKEIALVTVDCNLTHLQFADIVAEGKFAVIQISEQLRILLLGKANCPNKIRFRLFINLKNFDLDLIEGRSQLGLPLMGKRHKDNHYI